MLLFLFNLFFCFASIDSASVLPVFDSDTLEGEHIIEAHADGI